MKKYLIDSSLPTGLPLWKSEEFLLQSSAHLEALDSDLWAYATRQKLAIITKDGDFYQNALNDPFGPQVVHIHLSQFSLAELQTAIAGLWPSIVRMLEDNRALEVYTDLMRVQIRVLPV